ncbi:NAD-dependent epimerase/dehydratase family protein [Litoreibacter meonggei]|uniref:NAD-dependent epimerase/dehydratase family protein n=1 Tax=Litoreibacter meonggei TaxID=1049199 RepID=UPI0014743F31|nr:NAD-dependent epimerase/dehydratase family protein [Litoreibacter meonggei]
MRTQSRSAGFDLQWSPLEDGPDPLLRFNEAEGGLKAIVAMIGATPSTSGDMAQTAALAHAVVSAASQADVPRVLLASSSAVYALGEDKSESDIPDPISAYGQAKLDMERSVLQSTVGPEVCCLRIGNVAGADALLGRARDVTDSNPIKLDQFPDQKGPLRSYIGPAHLARCLEQLVRHEGALPPVLNCAAEPPVAMADLVQAANLPWVWSPAPVERYQTQRITLDCTLLAQTLGAQSLAASPDNMVAELRNLGVLA